MRTGGRMRTALLERAIGGLDRLAKWRKAGVTVPKHLAVGMDGEDAAFFYLRRKGYTVVARRWSSGEVPGDVDLIAWDGSMLCFVEVKTRTARDLNPAESAVDQHKRKNLRRLAHRYVRQLPEKAVPPVRFDVISVYLVPGQEREFVHFEASFSWNEGHRA
jgi:putative endonuclease